MRNLFLLLDNEATVSRAFVPLLMRVLSVPALSDDVRLSSKY